MASTSDIDTQAAVTKFLQSPTVVDKEDKTADSADEVQTILESVALSFLLYPQAALSFVLRANNVLQQIIATDLQILAFILKAIDDIQNPDTPITDTSDLTAAQTALIEIDRIGRVSSDVVAYGRYTQAVNSYLDNQLAKSVKRRHKNEFERTGPEASQDLFRVLSVFAPTHGTMITRLGLLQNSVTDFESVALTKIVATTTVARVRASLDKVIQTTQNNQLSKTASAIELLAGAAALSSISNSRKVYDPAVDTGTLPTGRTISVSSQAVPAVATGTGSPTSLGSISTPWVFDVTTDPLISGVPYAVTLPVAGASGRSYVKALTGSATFNISPSNCTLYVQFDGITPPANQPAMVRTVTLPTGGAVTLAAVLSALNNGGTGLINGTAVEMAPGTGRILIYGSSSVTRIIIRPSMPGSFDSFGNYSNAPGSVHATLGFSDNQISGDPHIFSPAELADLLTPWLTTATATVVNGAIQIASDSTDIKSSLAFSGAVAQAFGFLTTSNYLVQPSYLELIENGIAIDPATLGVFIGSIVITADQLAGGTNSLFAPVADINGTQLSFAEGVPLPRCVANPRVIVKVISPLVFAVQNLLVSLNAFSGIFDSDTKDIQRVLTPLLSNPTLAQINDATKGVQAIQTKVTNLQTKLASVVIRSDRAEFEAVATQIMDALEERGLDRALELLQSCQFSAFFGLTSEVASKGTRFLKASEQVGSNELAQSTSEQDMPEIDPKATTPDQNLLPGEELLEDEEQQ
jgi:hypothetical protein